MEHSDQTILANFWSVFTWHTLIEVIAIIFAAVVSHVILRFISKTYARWREWLASLSRDRARKRINFLFERYVIVWKKREEFRSNPYLATLSAENDNLWIIVVVGTVLLLSNLIFIQIVVFPLALVALVYLLINYAKIASERARIIQFMEFRRATQNEILRLRKVAKNDDSIGAEWLLRFEENAPF